MGWWVILPRKELISSSLVGLDNRFMRAKNGFPNQQRKSLRLKVCTEVRLSSDCEWPVSVPLYHVTWPRCCAAELEPNLEAMLFSSSLVSFILRVSWEMLGGNVGTNSR